MPTWAPTFFIVAFLVVAGRPKNNLKTTVQQCCRLSAQTQIPLVLIPLTELTQMIKAISRLKYITIQMSPDSNKLKAVILIYIQILRSDNRIVYQKPNVRDTAQQVFDDS